MRTFLWTSTKVCVLAVLILLCSCGDKIRGTFYLSEKAKTLITDTTITSFQMKDNHGMVEEFVLQNNYGPYLYLSEWGVDDEAWGENFYIEYRSVINRFIFNYSLRADTEHTDIEMEWNQKDRVTQNMRTGEITYGPKAEISYLDSLAVNGVMYYQVVRFDYTKVANEVDEWTPLVTYLGNKGLLKIVFSEDLIFQRLPMEN